MPVAKKKVAVKKVKLPKTEKEVLVSHYSTDYIESENDVDTHIEVDLSDLISKKNSAFLNPELKKNGSSSAVYKYGALLPYIKSGYCENIQIKNMIYEMDVEKKKDEIKIFYNRIGPKLKAIRQKAKVMQGDIADALGVASSHISLWENGKGKIPTHALCVYCDLCGVSPEFVLDYHHTLNTDINEKSVKIIDLSSEIKFSDDEIVALFKSEKVIETLKKYGFEVKTPETIQKSNVPALIKDEFFNDETLIKALARYSTLQQEDVKVFIIQIVENVKKGVLLPDVVNCKCRMMDELGNNREFVISFSHPEYTAFFIAWTNAKSKIREKLEQNGIHYPDSYWDSL